MAQQDNTLGAPTEGLGQTVTFAAGGRAGVPQSQAAQRGRFNLSAQGGAGQFALPAQQVQQAQPDATFGVLVKLAGQLLAPKAEEARNAAYLEGMRKAQQGEALQEIIDEQPRWSQLFGATPLVEGARAYTASSTATNIAVDLEASVEDTRKMEGPEYSRHVASIISKHTTGDPSVDLMVTQQASKTIPLAMKNQAKANLKYKADMRRQAEGNNADSAFSLLGVADAGSRDPENTKDSVDVIEAASPLIEAFMVPEGRDAADYNKVIANSAVKAIQSGNFAAYDLLKQSKKFAEFTPEEQYHIDRAHNQASAKARLTLPIEFGDEVAAWKDLSSQMGADSPAIIAGAKALNERYTKITGDRSPYITHTAVAAEALQLRNAERHREDQMRRAIDNAHTAEAKKQAEVDLITSRAVRVASPEGMYIGDLPNKDRQAVFKHVAAFSPETYNRVLVEQAKYGQYDDAHKDIMSGNFANAVATGNREMFVTEYRKYAAIVKASGNQGAAYADAYAGPMKEGVALYHSIAQGREISPLEAEGAFQQVINPPPKPATGKRADEVAKALTTGMTMGVLKGAFGDFVPSHDPAGLRDAMMPMINPRLPADEAVEAVRKQHPTLTELGGYHWQRPVTSKPVKQWIETNFRADGDRIGVTSNSWNKAFEHTVNTFSETAGITGTPQVYQGTDTPEGVPQLFVIGTGSDGNAKITHFNAEDMHRLWIEKQVKAKPAFGPAITNVPQEGAPSIYAPASEWEAYRRKQSNQ